MIRRAKIVIKGIVQGVGFRPFVYRVAKSISLKGFVLNDSRGVFVDVEGSGEEIEEFKKRLVEEKPKGSTIDSIESYFVDEIFGFDDFEIRLSRSDSEKCAIIPSDKSICPECLGEIRDKNSRRFGYFFTNCTECGPRYTIIKKLPYDRENTSMDIFEMCKECKEEYKNPEDRRFHAEPNSCSRCGPTLTLYRRDKTPLATGKKALESAAKLIKNSSIVAIKGLGGFHLVCDASKNITVAKLRERKRRPSKPFAVMFRTIFDILKCSDLDSVEEELILSEERPIVLINKRKPHRLEKFCISCEGVAPNIDKIGVFLPYTPLHVMLMDLVKIPIVVTSANISGEPLISSKEELEEKLNDSYDYLLDYDREILNPCDDSVAFVLEGESRILRRGRGYAPANIRLPFTLKKKILALGAQQKNSIAIGFMDNSIVSPHIGDLDTVKSNDYFEKSIELFRRVHDFTPEVIVVDKHPNYQSSKWGREFAKKEGIEILEIQHHYAHILSLMCENRIDEEILGVAWDGSGYGDDGNIWGGEFFRADTKSYKRVAHFENLKILGGDIAIKEPRRLALSLLFDLYGEDVFSLECEVLKHFSKEEIETLFYMHKNEINSIKSSSVGRIFDCVASFLGLLQYSTYEGEAGMVVESMYDFKIKDAYRFEYRDGVIEYKHIFKEMIEEIDKVLAVSMFINMLANIVQFIANQEGLKVGLSGGVFQNKALCSKIVELIGRDEVYMHSRVPANDGGISLGQIAYAKNF